MTDYLQSTGSIGRDEEVVAHVQATKQDDTQLYRKGKRYLCTHCSKGLHNNRVNLQRCKANGCECLCQVYYEGMDGKLRRHGTPDDSIKKMEERMAKEKAEREARELEEAKKILAECREKDEE